MADVGVLLNIAGGALLAVVGAWVLSIRPRRPGNVAFAVFAIAYGLRPIPANLVYKLGLAPTLNLALTTALALVAAGALVVLAVSFPRPLSRAERPALVGASAAAAALGAVVAVAVLVFEVGGESQATPLALVQTLAFGLLNTVTGAALVLLALRYQSAPVEEGSLRRQVALVSAALLSVFAFMATAGWSENASLLALSRGGAGVHPGAWMKAAEIALTLGVVALWLRNTAVGASRIARDVALYGAAILLLGMGYAAAALSAGGHGIARVAAVLILAVAISRFQLLDVDVKLRWGLRSGTLAAIFVGVFFVVSEGAQQLVAERTGSAMVGIVAAGLLVFVLTPLQRLADRVANVAVPTQYVTAGAAPDAATAYRTQVEIAWRDGRISPKEILMLRELRSYLGLPAELAERIESEVASGVPPAP